MTWLALALLTLATARATRLIAIDELARPMREWIRDHRPDGSPLTYLMHCPWCLSIWIATATTIAAWHAGLADHIPLDWWAAIPLITLAASHATGLLHSWTEGI